jgi:hypothetical protein
MPADGIMDIGHKNTISGLPRKRGEMLANMADFAGAPWRLIIHRKSSSETGQNRLVDEQADANFLQ